MVWQFTPYALPLFAGAALLLFAAMLALYRGSTLAARYLAISNLLSIVFVIGYAIELGQTTVEGVLLWSKIEYIGFAPAPVVLLLMILAYTDRRRWLSSSSVLLLSIIPTLTLAFAWTNELHEWVWRGMRLIRAGSIFVAEFEPGFWYWVNIGYFYLLITLCVLLLIRTYLRTPGLYRRQILVILGSMMAPLAAHVAYLVTLAAGLPLPNINWSTYAFIVTALCASWGVLRYRLFDLVPVARDAVVESILDGVIVLDGQDRIVDLNPAARVAVSAPVSETIGQPVGQVFSGWPDLVERCRNAPGEYAEVVLDRGEVQARFELRLSPLYDRRKHLIGRLVVLHDVTIQKQTELALRESEERLHTLIENIPADFWVMDTAGHYIVQNSTNRQIYGDAVGLALDDIAVDEQLKTAWQAINARAFKGESVAAEHEIEQEGEKRIFHQVVAPVKVDKRVIAIQGIGWDITEERRAARAQREHEQFLAALNEITRSALESPDLETMLQKLADRMGEPFAADGAYLTMWDETAQRTVTGAAYGAWRDRYRAVTPEPGEVTVTESVLHAGRLLAIEDVYDTPYLSKRIAAMFPDRSLLGLPLIADGRKLGAALIAYNDTHHFTETEIAHGEQVAAQIALALAKAHAWRLEREQRGRVEALNSIIAQVTVASDLQTLLDTTLDRLLSALDLEAGVIWLPPHLLVRGLSVGRAEIDEVIRRIGTEVSGPLVTTDWEQVDAQSELGPTAETMRCLGIRATLLVPLFSGELVIGGIGLVAFRPREWTVQEVSLAMAVGHQVGVAGRRRQMEEALHVQRDLALALGSMHDLATAMNHLLEQALRVEGIDSGGIYLVDQASGALDLVTHKGLSSQFIAHASHYDADSPQARMVMTGEPVYGSYPAISPEIDPARRDEGLRAIASIPVQHRAMDADVGDAPAVVAALNLASHARDAIPTTARSLLEAIAAQIGGVVARIRAEEALRQSQRNLQILFDTVDDFLFILDSEGRILHVNPVVERRLGYPAEELVGANVLNVHPLDRREEAARIVADMVAGKVSSCPIPLRARDGTLIPVETKVTLGKWDDQDVLFGISRDITERKRTEEALIRASRLEATATLAGGIAHDFNNLMVGVLGYADLLKTELQGQVDGSQWSDTKMMLDTVSESARKANVLAQQMLAFARGGKYQPQVIDLNDTIQQVVSSWRRTLPGRIQLVQEMAPDLWSVQADPTQMGQVILNLLTNAAEAISDDGQITVTTSNCALSEADIARKKHPCSDLESGDYICLSVRDTGCGMSEEVQARAFEPFFTTKFQGRGMGLAAAYGIVENHGGCIAVDSREGRGATFEVWLPAISVTVAKPSKPERAIEPPALIRPATVLVVEDDPPVRQLIVRVVRRLGYDALAAGNGREAVDIARSFGGEIHLVILDMGMPDMGGPETYPLLVAARPGIKVILCSGYEMDEAAQALLDAGASAFIPKPFQTSTLEKEIHKVLAD